MYCSLFCVLKDRLPGTAALFDAGCPVRKGWGFERGGGRGFQAKHASQNSSCCLVNFLLNQIKLCTGTHRLLARLASF